MLHSNIAVARGATLAAGFLAKQWIRGVLSPRPILHRAAIYDLLPQLPDWFLNAGHVEAKIRFLGKLRQTYRVETVQSCPFCLKSNLKLLANQERTGIPTSVAICLDCSLVFTNRRLDDVAIEDHYRRDYREIERGTKDNLHEFMFDLQKSKGSGIWEFLKNSGYQAGAGALVADIGAGEGGLVDWFASAPGVARSIGFELNQQAAAYARSRNIDVRDTAFVATGEHYDVIVLEQVLEHMSSPAALLKHIAASQVAGGCLYIGVPGVLESRSHYDDNFIAYLQYSHMFHYTLHTLERLVTPFGYRLIGGDETVRACFLRTSEAVPDLRTKMSDAASIIQFLREGERSFAERGRHFRVNRTAYVRYMKLLLKKLGELGNDGAWQSI